MTTTTPTNHTAATDPVHTSGPMNWFKFFQVERELWIQNISATQLSMQFEPTAGAIAGVLVPIGPDPLCLTNEVPFEAIKRSMDFRKFLNKVPAVMRVMTTEQADDYFAEKARGLNAYIPDPETGKMVPNVSAAREYAERERKHLSRPNGEATTVGANGQVYFSPPKTAMELGGNAPDPHMGVNAMAAQAAGLQQLPQGFVNGPFGGASAATMDPSMGGGGGGGGFNPVAAGFSNLGAGEVRMETLINPRVLQLCREVSMELPANDRMPADKFFREVKALAAVLTLGDLQYIQSNGTYKTVKKWAAELLESRRGQGQDEGIEDGLSLAGGI